MLRINFEEQPGAWVLSPGLLHSPGRSTGAQLKFHFPRSFVGLFLVKNERQPFLCAARRQRIGSAWKFHIWGSGGGSIAHLGSEFRSAVLTLIPEFSNSLFTMYQELLVCGAVCFVLSFSLKVVLELLEVSRTGNVTFIHAQTQKPHAVGELRAPS